MTVSNNPSNIPLPPPVNPSQTGSSQIGQQGSFVSQTSGPSGILGIHDQFSSGSTQSPPTHDPNIQPNNPSLPRSLDIKNENIKDLQGPGGTGNPWFGAQAIVAISVALNELAYALAKNKMIQAMMAADTLLQMTKTALEIAKDIRDEGHIKMIACYVAGAAAVGSGVLNISGSIHAGTKVGGQNRSASEVDRITMGYRGAGSIVGAAGDFAKGWSEFAAANIEANRKMLENMTQIWSEKLKNLDEASKASDPEAVFQMLQKISDALYQSLGWR